MSVAEWVLWIIAGLILETAFAVTVGRLLARKNRNHPERRRCD
jgi:hypothetical protein